LTFADVVIDGSGPYLDRFFTYRVPSELAGGLQIGQYVRVPWGKQEKGAFVAALRETAPSDLALDEIKVMLSVVDQRPLLDPLHWKLAEWLRSFYFGTWPDALRCLLPGPVLQGLRRRTKSRLKVEEEVVELESGPAFTAEQAAVWATLEPKLGRGETFLLHGVTGSGKTEIYLRATESILGQRKTALVLVPEVALTPQTQTRYRSRFGTQVSILHSGLTGAQRRQQWWRIRDGRARVVVGTRSAVFAPLKDCGLVILDEEHDGSYKQGSDIRYHARQVAAWLSRETKATVLLGSATPSLESYTLAQRGRYHLLEMKARVKGQSLPRVSILKGHGLPHQALQALAQRKARGEQSVILLNRRGFSNFLQCYDCGWVPECRSCSISLTYHQRDRSMRCHYCGASHKAPAQCPDCHGSQIEYPGRGTERLEQELLTRIPELRIARLDRDTVGGKGSVFQKTFRAFADGELDCLLGTQMVAKGLDFPNVTLVLVLQADTGLHLPDFRASERTFSLLTQVAGRAGRGTTKGEVLLVCSKPDLALLKHLVHHQWQTFMAHEQQLREAFRYPPYSRMLRVLMTDESEERLEKTAQAVGDIYQQNAARYGVEVLGPAPCPLERLQGRFRWHILLRAARVQDLQSVVRKSRPALKIGKTRLVYDPDPLELL
jgi:primosomal protein N' (replication factor Y) (superfamily II helicase)